MSSPMITLTFQPMGRSVEVETGTPVSHAARAAGVDLDYPCGGQGTCGKCKVTLVHHAGPPTEAEGKLLTSEEIAAGTRLACRTVARQSDVIEVPSSSLISGAFQILNEMESAASTPVDPPVRKQYVELPAPTLEDDVPDLDRLARAVGPVHVPLDLLRRLPARLRGQSFKGTAVMADGQLLDFEEGDTEATCHVAAFDIGTTTLAGRLYDLNRGKHVAATARMNPQTAHGDDVLSRILFATTGEENLAEIHADVAEAVNDMLAELAADAGIPVERIYEVAFAGNTTMQHLLVKLDPAALGQTPFTPACGEALRVEATGLDIRIHPHGRAYVFPVIGGFVGGDTVAGVLSTRLDASHGPTMLVDIGTNGEIVIFAHGKMIATSCAAGPAFEGALITHGMRAATGAIEQVTFTDDVVYQTIGDAPPVGLCGSALIDVVAELLRHGLLLGQGMLLDAESAPPEVPPALRERLIRDDDGPGFIIAHGAETASGDPVVLYQKDIREMQLATAAIRAGIVIMLRRAGVEIDDLDRLLVAGGFGNYVRCHNAQRIGLLPEKLEPRRFAFVGNTSLAGARQAARSLQARENAAAQARATAHVDLSLDLDFQEVYVQAMFFPEEDGVAL